MKNAIVIQHVEFEDAGHLAPLLQERGYRVTTYRPPATKCGRSIRCTWTC